MAEAPNPQENLLIGILGNEGAGKTYTWNRIFQGKIKTQSGYTQLFFNDHEYVSVVLLDQLSTDRTAIDQFAQERIVLCSLAYRPSSLHFIQHFIDRRYHLYLHWLNPGYFDCSATPIFDTLGFITRCTTTRSVIGIRNGKLPARNRVKEMRTFIYDWAKARNLIRRKACSRSPIVRML